MAGQVDVIRAGKGPGEGSGGNREALQPVVRRAGGKRRVCAAAGCQEPRQPAPLGGRGCHSRGAEQERRAELSGPRCVGRQRSEGPPGSGTRRHG